MGESSQNRPPLKPDQRRPDAKRPDETADDLDAQNKAKVEDFSERGMGVAGKE